MSLNWRAVILKGFMLAAGHQQLLFYKQDSEEIKETLFYKESLSVLVWPLFGSVALTLETVSKVTKTGKYNGGFGLKRSVVPPRELVEDKNRAKSSGYFAWILQISKHNFKWMQMLLRVC